MRNDRRLRALRDAADVLQGLLDEMPTYRHYIGLAMRRLRMIADRYEEQRYSLDVLAKSERKPPQRVSMRARRKPIASPPLVYEPGVGVQRRACGCGPFDRCDICREEPK